MLTAARSFPVALLWIFGTTVAAAQTPQVLVDSGDPFPGFTVGEIRDAVIGDDGAWSAAVTTFPALGRPLSVLHSSGGVVFTPGAVAGLPGARATLVNELLAPFDYSWSGTTITVSSAFPTPLVGERVELNFLTAAAGQPPADGVFTVLTSDPGSLLFTITHPASGACGGGLSPCGQVSLVRTVQSVDLNASLPCLPAYQGVMQLGDDEDLLTPPVIVPGVGDAALFWNANMLLREGALSAAAQVGPGTIYTRLLRAVVDANQDYLVVARMNDPAVSGSEDALVFLDVSSTCPPTVQSEQVIVRTGDPILNTANLRLAALESLEKRSFRLNERGDFLYIAALRRANGTPVPERSIVLNNAAILTEGQQIAGITGQIIDFELAALDLNDLGEYALQVKAQTSPHGVPCNPQPPVGWCGNPTCPTVNCFPHSEAILIGHAGGGAPRKFIQAGDPMPDSSVAPGETLLRVGTKLGPLNPLTSSSEFFPVLLTNGGDLIWYGEWGHLDGAGLEVIVGRGLFFNHKLLVQEGQPLPGGDELVSFGLAPTTVRAALDVSPNGRFLCFTGYRGSVAAPQLALFRIDLGESVSYGTVAQASGGPGCSYAFPPDLGSAPGLPLPGATLGDFPLLGHKLQCVATGAPATTVQALFAATRTAPANFPCGSFFGTVPFEYLLGTGNTTLLAVPYLGGAALLSVPIPRNVTVLIGTEWHVQAAYLDSTGSFVGATNAVRFVVGAP